MMVEERQYPYVQREEIQLALTFVRTSPKYGRLAPPDDEPRWDWLMFRTIANKIAELRTPDSNLAQLTGIVVRMFVPAWNKAMRLLGMAYRDAMMAVFRKRKEWQKKLRRRKKKRGRGEVPPDDTGQLVLI